MDRSSAASPSPQAQLMIVPVTFSQASAFVAEHHRHHKPPPGTKFVLGVARVEDSELVGVAMVGRPVAWALAMVGWVVTQGRRG